MTDLNIMLNAYDDDEAVLADSMLIVAQSDFWPGMVNISVQHPGVVVSCDMLVADAEWLISELLSLMFISGDPEHDRWEQELLFDFTISVATAERMVAELSAIVPVVAAVDDALLKETQ